MKEKPMKERILEEALQLFAQNGYTGTSMNDIAARLGVTKAALYKHYKSKQEILDSIVARADDEYKPQQDEKMLHANDQTATFEQIKEYTKEQFQYWTSEEFPSCFRRVLTLEQYRDPKMAKLYQRYLAKGPVSYMEPMFEQLTEDRQQARQLVLDFYGPIFLLYSIYDGAEEKQSVMDILDRHVESFSGVFQKKMSVGKEKQAIA